MQSIRDNIMISILIISLVLVVLSIPLNLIALTISVEFILIYLIATHEE